MSNEYFREEMIEDEPYWVDVKAGLIYQESLLFDHFGADIVDLKTYLPLFLESQNGGTRLPDGLRRLNPKLTFAEWRRCLELLTRFGEYNIRRADTETRILRYMDLHGFDTLQEAIDKHGQHSVEKSRGIRL